MAFWIRLWPFGNKSASQTSSSNPTLGSTQPPKQSKGSGLFKRAGAWVGETFEDSAKQAAVILRRTGQAMAREVLAQATLRLLVSRMQRDLEAIATICREQIATLRRRRFRNLDTLGISYTRIFTLTEELRRYVISYAEELQRPSLAQFNFMVPQRTSSTPGSPAATPAPAATSPAPPSNAMEIAALAPKLVLPDPKNRGRGYVKRRADTLAGIYQKMLDTVESIEHELHKARPISELETVTLVQRLNSLVEYLVAQEIAFGRDLKKGEPVVMVKLEDLARSIAGQ